MPLEKQQVCYRTYRGQGRTVPAALTTSYLPNSWLICCLVSMKTRVQSPEPTPKKLGAVGCPCNPNNSKMEGGEREIPKSLQATKPGLYGEPKVPKPQEGS